MRRSLVLIFLWVALVQAQVYTSTDSTQCEETSLRQLCTPDVCCVLPCSGANNPQSAIVQSGSQQVVFFSDTGCANSVLKGALPLCVGCSDGTNNSLWFANDNTKRSLVPDPQAETTENNNNDCLTVRQSDQKSCTWDKSLCKFPEYMLMMSGNQLLVSFPGNDDSIMALLTSWDNFGSPGFSAYAVVVAGAGTFDDTYYVDASDPSRWTIRATNDGCSMLRSDTVCNFNGGQITPIFGWPCPAPLYMSLYVNHYNSHTSQGCVVQEPSLGNAEWYAVWGSHPQFFNDTFSIACY